MGRPRPRQSSRSRTEGRRSNHQRPEQRRSPTNQSRPDGDLAVIPIFPPERSESLPRPLWGEADARLRAAGEGPKLLKIPKTCGATDNRAAQRSLTLTLSPRGARELEKGRVPIS